MTDPDPAGDLLRELAPQVLAALVRRYGYGQFYLCEDATQEALLAAAVQWPADGQPGNPRGWLVAVATRRLLDQVRSEQSRRQREQRIAVATPQSELLAAAPDADAASSPDDSLILLFGCCHPVISAPSQIALTLRAIGGLSTAQIAAAFGCRRPRWRSGSAGPSRPCTQRTSRCRPASGTGSHLFCTCFTSSSVRATPHPTVTRSPCPRSPARPSASPAGCAACCRTSPRWPACSRSCCSPTRAGPHAPRRTG